MAEEVRAQAVVHLINIVQIDSLVFQNRHIF